MTRFLLAALVVVLLSPSHLEAQPCFRMNMAAAPSSLANWPDVRNDESGVPVLYGTVWTLVHLPTGGPAGAGAYRLSHVGTTGSSGFYSGWESAAGTALCGENIPPQGSSRFGRVIFRYTPTNNFQCGGGNCVVKLILHADACSSGSSGCRAILELAGSAASDVFSFRLAVGGGDIPARTSSIYVPGTWYFVQYEMDSSTTPTSADGCFKIWVNTDNYGSPTASNGCNDNITTSGAGVGWGTVKFAGFHNFGSWSPGDVDAFEIGGYEYDDGFDPAFFSGGGGGGGGTQPAGPPSGLRVTPTPGGL